MPLIRVEWLAGRSAAAKAALARDITEAVVRHGGAAPDHVWVIFEDRAPGDWAVAGRPVATPPSE